MEVRLKQESVLIGRYEIQDVVGRGGMGTVYRARDLRLDMIVAVKEMTERECTPEERNTVIKQFEREAKLLGQLHHANLPRVTDYFVEEDHWYLVMEFVLGKTLDTKAKESSGKGLPLTQVLSWSVQIADVLAYLHGQNPSIVFRDVKPANIMVQDDDTVKLIDFGIARRFQDGATKDTLLYGSPGYSPPEQYGRAQTDPRSDIYALGATIHHMLTGRDPSPTPFKFPPIRSIDPNLPLALDSLLTQCVDMDESKRIQSASALRDALVHIRTAALSAPLLVSPASRPNVKPGTKPQTGPKVISSRVQAVDDARLTKRMTVIIVGVVLVVVLGIVGRKLMPKIAQNGTGLTTNPAPERSVNRDPTTSAIAVSKLKGGLHIKTTPPDLDIYLDDKLMGRSPLTVNELEPREHELRIVPARDSGFATYVRKVLIDAGQPKELDISLVNATQSDPSGSRATLTSMIAQKVDGQNGPLIRLIIRYRISKQVDSDGIVAVFFYGPDQTSMIHPTNGYSQFRTTEGQLTVSKTYHANKDEFIAEDTLDIPADAFPQGAIESATCRITIFVGQDAVYDTPRYLPLKF